MSRRNAAEKSPSLHWIIPAMKKFAELNYHNHRTTIRQFAAGNALPPRYCARLFRSQLGVGFRRYVLMLRMQEATRLLLV